jgi:hypothetical protein
MPKNAALRSFINLRFAWGLWIFALRWYELRVGVFQNKWGRIQTRSATLTNRSKLHKWKPLTNTYSQKSASPLPA